MNEKIKEIEKVIKQLEAFKQDPTYTKDQYAINENIIFLNAIRTVPTYISWLFGRAKKIDGERLLELTDFPVEEWDLKMHWHLIEVQRNKHIGLGKPLVDTIVSYISESDRDVVVADIGAGGMEIERQVVEALMKEKLKHTIVLVGIDKSPTTQEIAKQNLASVQNLKVLEFEHVDQEVLEKVKSGNSGIVVVLAKNNIFTLDKDFGNGYLDVVYHSLFRHHLTADQQAQLDILLTKIAKNIYDYDGYRTWPVVFPQTITAWQKPIFLSGTILSFLRYKKKQDIQQRDGEATFYKKTGHYLIKKQTKK